MSKTSTDIDKSGPQLPGGGGGENHIGGLRPIHVSDCRSAKRLLSRILTLLQKREIGEVESKTISYVVGILISAIKTSELENRVNELEAAVTQKGGIR